MVVGAVVVVVVVVVVVAVAVVVVVAVAVVVVTQVEVMSSHHKWVIGTYKLLISYLKPTYNLLISTYY